MSPLGRKSFTRDLLVLLFVGIVLASLFSLGLAATTGKYFAKAVTGVLGDYGQYDLLFQVRDELYPETREQLRRIIADRFPGSRLRPGLSIAGKSTIFLSLAKRYRTREVFESLYSYFGNLPGNAGYSIIAEPRMVVSAVPGGAQDLLCKDFARLRDVDFVFRDGGSLNLVLKSARGMDDLRRQVKRILDRYQLLEVRFSLDNPVTDVGALGRQLEQGVRDLPGVRMAKDVTRGGLAGDTQYMTAALSELRRFMVAYAARVTVRPVNGAKLYPGDRLVLQGRAPRLPVPGGAMDERYVTVKLDRVDGGRGEGLITQGDASYIGNVSAYKLLPGEEIGAYVGTVAVADERKALGHALDESINLLQQARGAVNDPAWDASGSLQGYQGIVAQIADVQKILAGIKGGLGLATSAETRESLRRVAAQIQGISGDLDTLAETTARLRLVENKVASVLDRVQALQFLFRSGLGQGAGGLAQHLSAVDQGVTNLAQNLRDKARRIDDFINRFNPAVLILRGWGERADVLAKELGSFSGSLAPGGKGRQALDSLLLATDSALKKLQGFDGAGLLQGMARMREELSLLGGVDLDGIIGQMQYVRDSLPKLLDEEIGRSVGMIDRYLGGEVVPGERIQLLTNAGADMGAVADKVRRISGRGEASLLRLPVGSLELDFRGEIHRVLGEVRTTITALALLALFVLEFLLDQTTIVAMLRRQADAVSRRVAGRRPRLARLAAFALNPARLYAGGVGALWLWACFMLTGARLPLVGSWGSALLGAIMGLLLGSFAERVNPINDDEYMAGESLGLPFVHIMREIVIPAGRPGLLQLLNRRRLIMTGGRRT